MHSDSLHTPQHRAMLWAAKLAQLPSPTADEQERLMRYARGQVADELVQHILYCSQATRTFNKHHLTDLLDQARANNQRWGVTGLLCYEDGHFVQLIEGPPAQLTELFARIEGDPRHEHVRVLSTGLGPLRQFTDWQLAVAGSHPAEFYWLTSYLEVHRHNLLLPQVPVSEPELVAQLESFSRACAGPADDAPGMQGLVQPNAPNLDPNHRISLSVEPA